MIVSELAHRSGVAPHVVRYYSRIGLLVPKRDPGNGYQRFNQKDLARLRFIRRAQTLGFTLEDIQEILSYEDNNASPCPKVREILGQRIEENLHQIEVLMEKQERMENAMVLWDSMPDKNCGSGSICHLIEAVPEKTSGA